MGKDQDHQHGFPSVLNRDSVLYPSLAIDCETIFTILIGSSSFSDTRCWCCHSMSINSLLSGHPRPGDAKAISGLRNGEE